ncbi:MAG: YaiO family outer membrane beta-barrel protein [Candidatus Omnitrophica bacterium]|nr:YaiO family outer membrane beta-barrel protein [Candidatus Omnitrophota bacterium]
MESRKLFVLLFVFLIAAPGLSHAAKYKNSFGIDYTEEYLTPHDDYGSWHKVDMEYSRECSETVKVVLRNALLWRDGEDSGISGGIGIYKDWTPRFYTYTGLSSGTDVSYIPQLWASQSFYFKVGPKGKTTVIPLGFSYINSRSDHETYLVSSGIIAYRGKWIYAYGIRRNQSEPGSVVSFSHHGSIYYGKQGEQWLQLGLSIGKWAYLQTDVLDPEEIDRDSFTVSMSWRKWLKENYGIKTRVSYFNLEDGYDKYGLEFGIFTEF